jgi:hypothetical protein
MSHEIDDSGKSFELLWTEFLGADEKRKEDLAFKFWNDFSGPATTEKICGFLPQVDREQLSVNCQWALLLCLHVSPSPEAIKIADIYLDAAEPEPHLLETAAWIIEDCAKGENLLTPEQKCDYARRMREAVGRCQNYNTTSSIVPIVVDFAGEKEETVDWLCEILEHHAFVPGAEKAFVYGMKIEPVKGTKALFFQLRHIRPDYLQGKAWVVEHLIFALEELNQKGVLTEIKDDELGFLANAIVEVANLAKPKWHDYRKPVTDAVLECRETVRAVLSRLPDGSASKKAILEILEPEHNPHS